METKTKMEKVKDLADLIDRVNAGQKDFLVALCGGSVVSRKEIMYDNEDEVFTVLHCIDGVMEEYNHDQLYKETNIGEAIEKGALLVDNQ